jgi:hypothetical protein
MSRAPALAVLTLAVATTTGCPSDPPAGPNPPILWLALDGSETEVRLVATEPAEF